MDEDVEHQLSCDSRTPCVGPALRPPALQAAAVRRTPHVRLNPHGRGRACARGRRVQRSLGRARSLPTERGHELGVDEDDRVSSIALATGVFAETPAFIGGATLLVWTCPLSSEPGQVQRDACAVVRRRRPSWTSAGASAPRGYARRSRRKTPPVVGQRVSSGPTTGTRPPLSLQRGQRQPKGAGQWMRPRISRRT